MGKTQAMTENYLPWNTDCICLLLKHCASAFSFQLHLSKPSSFNKKLLRLNLACWTWMCRKNGPNKH